MSSNIRLRLSSENISQFPHNVVKRYSEQEDFYWQENTFKDFDYTMSPEAAKVEKDLFKVLVVFHLNSNIIKNEDGYYDISATINEFWFYNFKTGEVYAKVAANR